MIRHLVRFGSSRADAEDLAQESLVIAWRKQGELDRDRSLDAFLYGIARNVYRNHTRTLRRRAEEPSSHDVVADARELTDTVALRDALHALPENQQDIVILHELEEYTLKETAELLAIPFDTAKDRLRRAREVLRERMHVDLEVAAASERRATNHIAKSVAPAVLVGVLGALVGKSAAAGAGAAGGAAAGGSTAASAGAAVVGSKLALGVAVALGLVVGVAVDRVALRVDEPTPAVALVAREPANVEREAPHMPMPVAPHVVDAGVSSPDASSTVVQTSAPPRPVPAPATSPEALLVERARVALRRGLADEAIRALMAHERRFPAAQLAEERDVLLIEAYLATTKLDLASARLAHYRATYPAGLHKQRASAAAAELERRGAP
ncbi:MAG: sigma-70 family RNA polymerase sigma factor [Myxococcota bacterium]|nr:sigma-70 family RNA polymerase sigma factor [Myxococcota bacterium]